MSQPGAFRLPFPSLCTIQQPSGLDCRKGSDAKYDYKNGHRQSGLLTSLLCPTFGLTRRILRHPIALIKRLSPTTQYAPG